MRFLYKNIILKPFFLWLIVLIQITLLSFSEKENIIIWDKNYKLQFSDFTPTSNPLPEGSTALTSTGIFLDRDKTTPSTWKAFGVFDKKESKWYINGQRKYDSLVLHHEQIHFDISNLYAQLLDTDIQRLGKNLNKQLLKSLYDYYTAKMDSMQLIHDTSPGYARDSASQRRWNKHMDSLLRVRN